MKISERQQTLLRKYVPTAYRSLNVEAETGEIAIHGLSWRDLSSLQSELMKAARINMDRLDDNSAEAEVRAVSDAHDTLIEIHDALGGEKNIRSALGDKGPREAAVHPRRPNPNGESRSFQAIDEERDEEFTDEREERTVEAFALRSNETFAERVEKRSKQRGRASSEFRGLSEGDYLRAMVLGPKTALEKRALAEGTDSAGGYTVPELLASRMIDRLRAKSVLSRLGAQTVPLFSDVNSIARVASDPSPSWRMENAAATESEPTFDRIQLNPKSLMVIVRVSRELLEDSVNISSVLPDVIAQSMAAELDRAGLLGSGVSPMPRGVTQFSGLTASSFAGGVLGGYGPLIRARTALRSVNADMTGIVMHPREEGYLAELVDDTGQPLNVPQAIAQIPILTTTTIPANLGAGTDESKIIAGDWRQLLIGIRSELRIEILRERYADFNQYALAAHLRVDFAAEHEKAFTVLSGTKIA